MVREAKDIGEIVKDVVKNKDKYLQHYNGRTYIDTTWLSIDYKIGDWTARRVKHLAEVELGLAQPRRRNSDTNWL